MRDENRLLVRDESAIVSKPRVNTGVCCGARLVRSRVVDRLAYRAAMKFINVVERDSKHAVYERQKKNLEIAREVFLRDREDAEMNHHSALADRAVQLFKMSGDDEKGGLNWVKCVQNVCLSL